MTKQTYRGGAVGAYNAKPNLETRRRTMKYKVTTSSTTARGVVPIKGATQYPAEPTIYFTREAWVKQCHLVDKCDKEVGWFALVDYCTEDNSFTITELVIPKQEVTAAETDIGKEDLADAAMELIEQGKDTGKLYAWFHSHVNMGVGPSAQDEYQVEDYLEDLADQPEVPAFIRGIQNKKGDLKLDVYYIQHGVAYQNVEFYVIHDDDPQWLVDIEAQITAKVSERTHQSYYSGYNYGGGYGGGRQNAGKSHGGAARGNVASIGNANAGYYDDRFNGWGYDDGFRRAYRDWSDAEESYDTFDRYDATDVDMGAVVGSDDSPAAPKAVALADSKYERMEIIYSSPDNLEVMLDDDGCLWVCDEAGDMYPYDDYTEAYGEIDGDVVAARANSQPVK